MIILDSGSNVSLLPTPCVADAGSDTQHALRDCQRGALRVTGTGFTDLQVQDLSGEDGVLRHQLVVCDVTTSLLSLGQLYQLGWRLHEAQDAEQLCLVDPSRCVCVWTISKDVKLVTHHGQDPYPFLLPFLWSGIVVLQNWAGPLPSL